MGTWEKFSTLYARHFYRFHVGGCIFRYSVVGILFLTKAQIHFILALRLKTIKRRDIEFVSSQRTKQTMKYSIVDSL